MAKKKKRIIRPKIELPDKCPICEAGEEVSYKNYKFLKKFITDRAKILGKNRTGVCSRHQRQLSQEVKRARHLGLLPFTPQV